MSESIVIIDYNIGNLRSVQKSFEKNDCDAIITNNHEKILNADKIVLPGVGSFRDGMNGLLNLGLVEVLNEAVIYNKKPFLGICLGMQCAVIEYARNILNMPGANSTEMKPNTKFPVIDIMEEQKEITNKGGTMRLGLYEAKLKHNSLIKNIYKSSSIKERHRHRYEVNNNLKNKFEEKGMIFSGMSPDNQLPEIIELKNHPWFIGVQFHPEFKSRPLAPHPLFSSFIKAAKNHK